MTPFFVVKIGILLNCLMIFIDQSSSFTLPISTTTTTIRTTNSRLFSRSSSTCQQQQLQHDRSNNMMNDESVIVPTTKSQQFSRRNSLQFIGSTILSSFVVTSLLSTDVAYADVSDGNTLPQGAQQFARIIRLKTDIGLVRKRLKEGGNDIDKKEWDNINNFLRAIYSVAENDIKFVTKTSIYDTTKKERAFTIIEQIKKYAQAGDVSVSKKDTTNLIIILDKCSELMNEFLDSLRDVPDEI